MDRQSALALFERMSGRKILVIGDFMLDQFLWGRVDRISPEAPVPVVDVERETFTIGGAGNVVMNLLSLGAIPIPLGVCGEDWAGTRMLELLERAGVKPHQMQRTARPTTLKTRIIAHQQQVVRVDREQRALLEPQLLQSIAASFASLLPEVDAVVVSDYSKGLLSPELLSVILPAARRENKIVCLDPKIRYFSSYSPVTVITPNQSEAASMLGYPISNQEDLEEAARRILKLIDCRALLITRGEKGMALFSDGTLTLVPTRAREVYDVTGAGDTVIATLCASLAAGADLLPAVQLANVAAGIVVGKVGTATVTREELLQGILES